MGILYRFEELENAIIHDINTLERYDDEVAEGHCLSAVIFNNESEMDSVILADILKKASRKSDLIFFKEKNFVILMPATDKTGAEHIFEAMHDVCRTLKKRTVLTYPADGFNDEAFSQKVRQALTAV